MNLHWNSGKPDWASVEKRNRNYWQRLAASTSGIITQGNIATLIGFVLVLVGLRFILLHHYALGVLLLCVGRFFDMVDGWLADLTKTKSPLGELLDAGIDKLVTLLSVITLYIAGLAPWWILLVLAIPHFVITGIAYANIKKRRLHPSLAGKSSMATAWLSLIGFVGVRAFHIASANWLTGIPTIVAIISVALGCYTVFGYLAELRK